MSDWGNSNSIQYINVGQADHDTIQKDDFDGKWSADQSADQ